MKKAIPILVVLTGLCLYVYFFHIQPSREFDPTVRGTGSIETTEVVVSSKIPARIQTMEVFEGQQVTKGQVIARLHCQDVEARLAQAEAQIERAKATVEQTRAAKQQAQAMKGQASTSMGTIKVGKKRAQRELDRANKLIEIQGIPQRAVDDAETAVDSAHEQMLTAKQTIKVSSAGVMVAQKAVEAAQRQVELAIRGAQLARVQLAECTLTAPLDGVITRRSREPGEMLMPGSAVVKIADLKRVFTWIYVPNEEIGKLRVGQKVRLFADTYPERKFTGTVARINEQAEFTPKSVQTKDDRTRLVFGVKVEVSNDDGALMPGMPVEAELVEMIAEKKVAPQ